VARTHTQALTRKMKAIRDPAMRTSLAGAFLREQAADEVVATLHELVGEVRRGRDPAEHALVDALTTALGSAAVSYEVRTQLYGAAKAVGYSEVARLLFDASPVTERTDLERILSPERQVVPRGRILTLGERKALARTNRRDLIMHVVRDPHPDVVAIFLDNPHVTEGDVVGIAANRGAHPDALAAVAAHARWRVRQAIRRALTRNPATPAHVSLRLLVTLRAADLRDIAADPHLPEELRAQAAALTTQKPDQTR
jgi:hypothetical protein